MPHLTTCTRCGRPYEESSEERANEPAWTGERLCHACHALRRMERGAPGVVTRALALLRAANLRPFVPPATDSGFVLGWYRDHRTSRVHIDVTHDGITRAPVPMLTERVDAIARALAPLADAPGVTATRTSVLSVHVSADPDASEYISHDHGFATSGGRA